MLYVRWIIPHLTRHQLLHPEMTSGDVPAVDSGGVSEVVPGGVSEVVLGGLPEVAPGAVPNVASGAREVALEMYLRWCT